MTIHSEKRVIRHTPEQLFQLVADVQHYPAFLPWCLASRIRTRSEDKLVADLIIGFQMFREQFTSHVQLDKAALKILKKKKNLRLIDATNYSLKEIFKFISANEEILVQTEDLKKFSNKDFRIVSKKKPSSKQMKNLIFAFNICRYVKSNAIVLASNESTTGIGSGQPSRLDSCQIALDKMKKFVNTND